MPVRGLRLHFVYRRSSQPGATPLLFTHGWPGSFLEVEKVIGPLTEPQRHGAPAGVKAFHVVAPSMPGYGFSEAPRERGFGPGRCVAFFSRGNRASLLVQGTRVETWRGWSAPSRAGAGASTAAGPRRSAVEPPACPPLPPQVST